MATQSHGNRRPTDRAAPAEEQPSGRVREPLPHGRGSDQDAFQTKAAIRRMLDSAGLSPRKRHGQHFLIDRNLMMKLVDSAEIGPADCVVEVGAGSGSLTALLAERAGHVIAVEIDEGLAGLAKDHLAAYSNVVLLRRDVLARKSAVAEELSEAIRAAQAAGCGPLKLAANLPYDIATPLIVDLLLSNLPFSRLCFTVQAEVADRFLAKAGTSDYGHVSIVTQLLARGVRVCRLPPQAFWPMPKVHSVMLRLDRRPADEIEAPDPVAFSEFVKSFFLHRRKKMSHLARLRADDGSGLAALEKAGISGDARPQTVALPQWIKLYRSLG